MMGICPQFDILWRSLSVRETLLFYTRLKGVEPSLENQSVEDSLASVGLTEFADRKVKELSGGMKRRVSLAVSLCGNARVVFLDEPTTGLDPVTRRDLWDTLLQMKKQNRYGIFFFFFIFIFIFFIFIFFLFIFLFIFFFSLY